MHTIPALAAAACLFSAAAVAAPLESKPLESNAIMEYDNPKDWIVSARVFVYSSVSRRTGPSNVYQAPEWTYTDFTMVLPFATESGAAWLSATTEPLVKSAIAINGYPANLDAIPSGAISGTNANYAILNIPGTVSFNRVEAMVRVRITSADTEFDQQAAWDLPWTDLGGSMSGWLNADPVYDVPLPDGRDPVKELLDQWTGGNDPKQIPPVQLAKYLTANVLELMRTTGSNRQVPTGRSARAIRGVIEDGSGEVTYTATSPSSSLVAGFNVKNAGQAMLDKMGSEHDLANVLTAVFRRAGLHARTVIGVDNEESGDDEVKSWVEFAIKVPDVKEPVWIPIDVRELEGDGRTTRDWERPWKHFGTSDLLRQTPPIAYYFHPPAGYRAHGLPALFGIRSIAELPEYGEQAVDFEVVSAPNRGGQPRRP